MKTVYLGLGSNKGDKRGWFDQAIERLDSIGHVVAKSEWYETKPFGVEDQEWFLNGVVAMETDLEPDLLMEHILDIEERLFRRRVKKNGPRTIDIDILLYGDDVYEDDDVTVPHPRMHERWSVLKPLCDIAPDVIHPKLKKTAQQLLDDLPEGADGSART